MKSMGIVTAIIICLLTTSCADKTISLESGFDKNKHTDNHRVELYYFLGEFGTDEEINALNLCTKGISGLQFHTTLVDSLIAMLSLGIFTPKTITLYCNNELNLGTK